MELRRVQILHQNCSQRKSMPCIHNKKTKHVWVKFWNSVRSISGPSIKERKKSIGKNSSITKVGPIYWLEFNQKGLGGQGRNWKVGRHVQINCFWNLNEGDCGCQQFYDKLSQNIGGLPYPLVDTETENYPRRELLNTSLDFCHAWILPRKPSLPNFLA